VTGNDLINAVYVPGPRFKEILAAVEDSQLEGQLQNKEQALRVRPAVFPGLSRKAAALGFALSHQKILC
jgi:hypothetical protein